MAEDNKFISKPEMGISAEESVFLASLICNVRYAEHFTSNVSLLKYRFHHMRVTSNFISFTGQRILTWDLPEIKEAKISRPHGQQGSNNDSGRFPSVSLSVYFVIYWRRATVCSPNHQPSDHVHFPAPPGYILKYCWVRYWTQSCSFGDK